MMEKTRAIRFLTLCLIKRQKAHAVGSELHESDFLPPDEHAVPLTCKRDERIARLADEYGLDGSMFRYVHTNDLSRGYKAPSTADQILEIPRIIAAIEAEEAPHQPKNASPSKARPKLDPKAPNWSKPCSKTEASSVTGCSTENINAYLKRNPHAVKKATRQKWVFDKNHPFFASLP